MPTEAFSPHSNPESYSASIGGKPTELKKIRKQSRSINYKQSEKKSGRLNSDKSAVKIGEKTRSKNETNVLYLEAFVPSPPQDSAQVARLANVLADFQLKEAISTAELRNLLRVVPSHLPDTGHRSITASATDREPLPTTWEEAKAQVPGLIKWVDAHRENPDLTIIDHLRDRDVGYGKWTLSPQGLPRKSLEKIDNPAHWAVYNWARPNRSTGHRNEIPADMRLPTRSEVTRQGIVGSTWEEVRETNRKASLLRRIKNGSPSRP